MQFGDFKFAKTKHFGEFSKDYYIMNLPYLNSFYSILLEVSCLAGVLYYVPFLHKNHISTELYRRSSSLVLDKDFLNMIN